MSERDGTPDAPEMTDDAARQAVRADDRELTDDELDLVSGGYWKPYIVP